jgi:acyl-coenzyme A thioesterase PaaI-like protein
VTGPAFQDLYPDDFGHCYGCGRHNPHGHQLKSRWDGEETVAVFTPLPWHTSVPGFVYGGLIASLIDCHAMGTAAAARHRADNGAPDALLRRYVTASLTVNYLRPTPLGGPLEVRARAREVKGRKVVVDAWLSAGGEVCVRGEAVAVEMPETMMGGRGKTRK